jgi:hypothetical protein
VYKQVSGKEGIPVLLTKVKTDGPSALFQGALATSLATVVSCHCILYTIVYVRHCHRLPHVTQTDNAYCAIDDLPYQFVC